VPIVIVQSQIPNVRLASGTWSGTKMTTMGAKQPLLAVAGRKFFVISLKGERLAFLQFRVLRPLGCRGVADGSLGGGRIAA
jgi:hypothetical protein